MKTKQELIKEWESAIEAAEFYGKGKEEKLISYMKDFVSDLNQLDESEVLSQEWIDEHRESTFDLDLDEDFETVFIKVEELQNLLVPKQDRNKIKKYIIYMTGISGEKYKFYTGQSTVNMVDQFTAGGRRFLWIKDEHAVNLNNIEHVQIHEIEEGEKPR